MFEKTGYAVNEEFTFRTEGLDLNSDSSAQCLGGEKIQGLGVPGWPVQLG